MKELNNEFEIDTFENKEGRWFCINKDNIPTKLNDLYPVWFCLSFNGYLSASSNDPRDKSQFKVIYHKSSFIRSISPKDNYFDFFDINIKAVTCKKYPQKLIAWSKSGYVYGVIHDEFYYEYSETDGKNIKILNLTNGDIKYLLEETKARIELNMNDEILDFFIDNQHLQIPLFNNLSQDELNRLKNAIVWTYFPTEHLSKDRFISRDQSDLQYFIIRSDSHLFFIDTQDDSLKLTRVFEYQNGR